MKLYSENENYKLYEGSMLDMLEVIEPNTIDSVVCDPPYELNFMGKGWDNSGIAFQSDTWGKCYEVLKPGGYLLAFGGSRTFHRIACAIEDAGFEIRDTICWMYGSGFPKSMNIGLAIDKKNGVESKVVGKSKSGNTSKAFNLNEQQREAGTGILAGEYDLKEAQNEWNGWGTALKPSFEPIIVARKPFKGSLVDNVIEHGVGGINIDECRVGNEEISYFPTNLEEAHGNKFGNGAYMPKDTTKPPITHTGRFPANTILTYDETDFDEVCGGFPNTSGGKRHNTTKRIEEGTSYYKDKDFIFNRNEFNDSGSASRYFYCAKASKKDRDEGLDEFDDGNITDGRKAISDRPYLRKETLRKNTHPTVKPTELMQYLVRLVTPNNGTILDPFNGSGSTGKAVMYENKERNKNYKYIGIELTEEYLPIAKARIEYVCNLIEEEKTKDKQLSIFDIENEVE